MAKKTDKLESAVPTRNTYKIVGGEILVFADTHFSYSYEGKFINYAHVCLDNMAKILSIVKETKPAAVVFLGDIIGVREHNINDRQFLMRVVMFFGMLYNITKGNVYVVKGNHDMGDFTDFDFIAGLGYFKNPKYLDYMNPNTGEVEIRFHFVNYGDENLPLDLIKSENSSNVVFGHADYYIEGVTTWYSEKKGRVELKNLNNFCGVEFVFSGHIHIPSKEVLYTNMSDGEVVGLFYPGSCSRTAERYKDCWYLGFYFDEESGSASYHAELMGLLPLEEILYDESEFIDDESSEELDRKTEALSVIIEEIFTSRLATGDVFSQIDKMPADDDVKNLAKEYLQKAMLEV